MEVHIITHSHITLITHQIEALDCRACEAWIAKAMEGSMPFARSSIMIDVSTRILLLC